MQLSNSSILSCINQAEIISTFLRVGFHALIYIFEVNIYYKLL